MKVSTTLTIVASLLSLSLLAGCGGGGGNALATVNGENITLEEFTEHLETKETVRVVNQSQGVLPPGGSGELQVMDTLAFQGMRDLVASKLLMQMATDEKVAPTDADVDAEIKLQTAVRPEFVSQLQQRGMSMGSIRRRVRMALAAERLLTKGINVTDAEVEEFIKANPNNFREPATANVTQIFVANEAARTRVDAELAKGRKFADVAAELNANPQVRQNPTSTVILDRLTPQLRNVLTSTPINKSTNWIQDQGGFVKLYVNSRTAARNIEMTTERKALLKRDIARARGSQGRDLDAQIQERLKTAKIEVKEKSMEGMWSRFMDRVKQGEQATSQSGSQGAQGGNANRGN